MSVVMDSRHDRSPDDLARIAEADEARRRKRRRRRIGGIVGVGLLVLLIAAAVLATIGFQQSWWMNPSGSASSDQTTAAGDTRFTDSGRDYAGRHDIVRIDLRDDVHAAELGLPDSGTTKETFIVPLTIRMAAGSAPFEYALTDRIDLTTRNGRLVAVHIPVGPDSIVQLFGDVSNVADDYGWQTEADDFDTDFLAQWDVDRATASARFGPVERGGLSVSALLATRGPGPVLDWTIEKG